MSTRQLVGITWREARTGRVKTQTRANLRTIAALVAANPEKQSNALLLARICAVCAVIVAAVFAFCMWLDGWHFIFHTPRFWRDLGAVLFQQ